MDDIGKIWWLGSVCVSQAVIELGNRVQEGKFVETHAVQWLAVQYKRHASNVIISHGVTHNSVPMMSKKCVAFIEAAREEPTW